jgi:hypothetical protein
VIYYLVLKSQAVGMYAFLAGWGSALASRITIMHYESVLAGGSVRLPEGAYIFASLGDLGDPGSALRDDAGRLYRELADAFGAARVINDPGPFLKRFDLLETLHARGINRFTAYRAGGPAVPRRFPVFLRLEIGSEWRVPALLNTVEEYRAAVARAQDPAHTIGIEFCDTSDGSGIYRKYSCFVVGERVVPRHLFFSRRWFVKEAELDEPGMAEEEQAFLDSNPHAKALLEVCRIAGIGYGRLDYALLDGRVQIWEINHTPLIAGTLTPEVTSRQTAHKRFLAAFSAALDAIDPPGERA